MSLTKEEMEEYLFDPNRIMSYTLNNIEKSTNGERVVTDPTNPFTFLLEASVTNSTNAIIEARSVIKKKYPILATETDELYHHLSEDEMANMISEPADAPMNFYINVLDLKQKGHRPLGASFVETIIPIGTTVKVVGYTLTLLNDILVRLYDNNSIFVEQQPNDNDISYDNIGILESRIINDSNGAPFIIFQTRLKQVKMITKLLPITPGTNIRALLPLEDKYYYSEVFYKNKLTNDKYVKLPKAFNDEYINPRTPTCWISIYNNNCLYRIPEVYLIDGKITGNLKIVQYETKGESYIPLDKFDMSKYTAELGDTTTSVAASTMRNMLFGAISPGILQGGKNGQTLDELRDNIIYHTTGDIDLPITEKQLERSGSMYGFEVKKSEDVLTHRQYIGNKNLPDFTSELLYARKDILFETFVFRVSDLINKKSISELDNKIIIKSNSIFKVKNGVIEMVNDIERKGLEEMEKEELIERCKDNKYFYNPFYYVIDKDIDISTISVYDMDNPKYINKKIVAKNNTFTQRVNINSLMFNKTEQGYRFGFNTFSNQEYDKIDLVNIGFQVKIMLNNGITFNTYEAKYDATNKYWYIDILTNLQLNTDDTFDIQNGESELFVKRCKLNTYIEVLAYTTDRLLKDETNYLRNELLIKNYKNVTVLTKERIDVVFGKQLKYIWDKIYTTVEERLMVYEKYTEDVPKLYDKDVYKVYIETGSIYKCENGQLISNKLHNKGDPYLDNNGNPVYLHRKGDVKYVGGNKVIDKLNIERYMDMLLFEYEFLAATSSVYLSYNKLVHESLSGYITDDLDRLNNKLLEQTEIKFKSFRSIKDIVVEINYNLYHTPVFISPIITLYVNKENTYSTDDIDIFKNKIGNILNDEFNNSSIVQLENIRSKIKEALGENVLTVKITDIDPSNSEVLSVYDKTSKFTLRKILALDNNNELIVKYNIVINIQYI